MLKKKVIKVFGKTYYFLGTYKDGTNYYIQEPSWDCDWYWGGIYIQSFSNNRCPERSKDIALHVHFDYFFFNHNGTMPWEIWENDFKDTALTKEEMWKLFELAKSFYTLTAAASIYKYGGSNFTGSLVDELDLKSNDIYKSIVKVHIPKILNKFKEILTDEKPEVDYFSKQITFLK